MSDYSSSPSEQSSYTKIMACRKQMESQTNIALTLTNHILTKHTEFNVAISPISLQALLYMLAFGSKGSTRDQILSFLGLKNISVINDLVEQVVGIILNDGAESGGPMISFCNGAWLDSSLSWKKEFEGILYEKFKAEFKKVDFKYNPEVARNEINSWVENATKGHIKHLLPPRTVKSTTEFILGNALYFKGIWRREFESSNTEISDFYLLDGSSVQVPFMTTDKMQFINVFDDFSVLGLPYSRGSEDNKNFSMYVFLPREKDGLHSLSVKLCSDAKFVEYYLPWDKAYVNKFKLPKFKISFGFRASETFECLGLDLPFHGKGDLTGMVESSAVDQDHNVRVSRIIHKSFIEVNEEGTEAAAATFVSSPAYSSYQPSPRGPFDFVADHPFIFLIREDRTGALLFTGHVVNPLRGDVCLI